MAKSLAAANRNTSNHQSKIPPVIAALSAAGVVISSISLFHHYATSKSSFCDFGNSFNCDMVNRSIYSTVAGIPVALLGILGYTALFIFSVAYKTKAKTRLTLLVASIVGLAFALYLTYIEAFVLAVWCILCLSSLAIIITIVALAARWVATASSDQA